MEHILELLAHEGGVLVRREHCAIARQLDYAVRTGCLRALLPGIYTVPEPTWEARIRAAAAFRPGCVITGAAAAQVLWWPEVPIERVSAVVAGSVQGTYPGFSWERRTLPPELIVDRDEIRLAHPAASVLDLIPILGGAVIDEALRRKSVTMDDLWWAFGQLPHRSLNRQRRALLDDSRDAPWSEAERMAHRLLRAAGLIGFKTNHRIVVKGACYQVDIAFPIQRVLIEIDGWQFHNSRSAFTQDRWRYARLAAARWRVLPFSASALTDDPGGFVEVVRTALDAG